MENFIQFLIKETTTFKVNLRTFLVECLDKSQFIYYHDKLKTFDSETDLISKCNLSFMESEV
jgi:hypothetical protein